MTFSIFTLNFRATVNYLLALTGQAATAAYLRLEILIIQPLINIFLIFKIMYHMENIVQKDIVNIYIQSYRNLMNQTVRILNMVLLHIIAN